MAMDVMAEKFFTENEMVFERTTPPLEESTSNDKEDTKK
jgi:hypothetical protein